MPVLLASIISGPAVLWCSSIDCERQWDGLKCGHSFVLGCVCWSLALHLLCWERAGTGWANGQILAELANRKWRDPLSFREKKSSEAVYWVWALLQAQQGLRWEMGFGLPAPPGLAQHQRVSVMTWGCHPAAAMFVPGLALSMLWTVTWGKKINEKKQQKCDWLIKCRWNLCVNKCPGIHIKKIYMY